MNNILLQCSHVSKTYTDEALPVEVLKDISLIIHEAETVAIVGSSGSGKSTLLHLLGGLDKPNSGEINLAGKNMLTLSEKEKCYLRNQHLGFVYQFHHLLPEFTALENVSMPLLIRNTSLKIAKEKAEYFLTLTGLQERLHHKPNALSGGERQRVAIARALVGDPLCVLADEPTGNLDPYNASRVLDLFFELQEKQKTSIVMVTHDEQVAKQAKTVFLLKEGKLV